MLLIHETAAAGRDLGRARGGGLRRCGRSRYDRRGWGASEAPEGYRRTTVEEQSEDAAVLLEALGATGRR